MSWLFTKKNNYIPVLELLLVLLSVWPLNSHAKSSLCEVGVSSELMLESQRLEQALPGAAFNLSESKVNKAFLNTEGSYTRLSQSQIVEVFPTENTYRIVEKDSKLFLIFAVYSKVEKFRRIKVIPLESKNSSLTCSKVVKYKKLLDEQTALLQNSLHIYSGKNPHGTFGASLINLESLRYQSEKTQYPTKTMLTAYNEILEVVKELLHSDRSLLGGIETIRQVLIERGFEGYCRNNISFLDFIQKGCTNCQGQTMLVLSLAMDAHLKKDETWELGFQVFSDHIAPVLYDSNENIIDLIYATKAKDTGDPVFKAEKLMMFALKMSKERLGPNAQEKIKSESRKRAENFSYKNLFKSIFIRPITTLLSAPSLDEAVPLFDLSGIMAVSSFSPELPPETATLNLSGSLLNPLEKSKHSGIDTLFGKMFDSSDNYSEFGGQGNNKGWMSRLQSGMKDLVKTKDFIYCDEPTDETADFLSAQSILDRDRIIKKRKYKASDKVKYGESKCPGEHFLNRKVDPMQSMDDYPLSYYEAEEKSLAQITNTNRKVKLSSDFTNELKSFEGTYKEKVSKIRNQIVEEFSSNLMDAAELFNSPLSIFAESFKQSNHLYFTLHLNVRHVSEFFDEELVIDANDKRFFEYESIIRAWQEFLLAYMTFSKKAVEDSNLFFSELDQLSFLEVKSFFKIMKDVLNISFFSNEYIYRDMIQDLQFNFLAKDRKYPSASSLDKVNFIQTISHRIGVSVEEILTEAKAPLSKVVVSFLTNSSHRVVIFPESEEFLEEVSQEYQEQVEKREEQKAQEAREAKDYQEAMGEAVKNDIPNSMAGLDLPDVEMTDEMMQEFEEWCSRGNTHFVSGFVFTCPKQDGTQNDPNLIAEEDFNKGQYQEAQDYQEELEQKDYQSAQEEKELIEGSNNISDALPTKNWGTLEAPELRQISASSFYFMSKSLLGVKINQSILLRWLSLFDEQLFNSQIYTELKYAPEIMSYTTDLPVSVYDYGYLFDDMMLLLDPSYPLQNMTCIKEKSCLITDHKPKLPQANRALPFWVQNSRDIYDLVIIKRKQIDKLNNKLPSELINREKEFRTRLDRAYGIGTRTEVNGADMLDGAVDSYDVIENKVYDLSSVKTEGYHAPRSAISLFYLDDNQILTRPR